MVTNKMPPQNIDDYIASFPEDIQVILEELRVTIRNAAPGAKEKISYGMPTFALEGNLVHFAAFKGHIGFYPSPTGIEEFKDELAPYAGAKGSIRFPSGTPIPFDLISRIVAFRVKENFKKAEAKNKTKKRVQ